MIQAVRTHYFLISGHDRDIFIAGRRTEKRAASSGVMRQEYTQSALWPAGGDATFAICNK